MCGVKLVSWRKVTCSVEHRTQLKTGKETPVKPKPEQVRPKRKRYVSPVDDKAQMEINRSIDNKHSFNLVCRTIKKGSREFKELARLYA